MQAQKFQWSGNGHEFVNAASNECIDVYDFSGPGPCLWDEGPCPCARDITAWWRCSGADVALQRRPQPALYHRQRPCFQRQQRVPRLPQQRPFRSAVRQCLLPHGASTSADDNVGCPRPPPGPGGGSIGNVQVWAKPQPNNAIAVLVINNDSNMSSGNHSATIQFSQLNITAASATVRAL